MMTASPPATARTAVRAMRSGPLAALRRKSGRAKLTATSAITPPVAGTTPRRTACTVVECSTWAKSAASRHVMAPLGISSPVSDATMPRHPPSRLPSSTVIAIRLMPGVSMQMLHRRVNSCAVTQWYFSMNVR